MKDCKIVITVQNGVINIEGQGVSLEELAVMSGFLQAFAATEALKQGMDIDEVKNNMLDIHLAAMETLEEQFRQ